MSNYYGLVIQRRRAKRNVDGKKKLVTIVEAHVMNGDETFCGLDPIAQTAVDHMPGVGTITRVVGPGVRLTRIAPDQLVSGMEVCYACRWWASRFNNTPPDVKETLEKHVS